MSLSVCSTVRLFIQSKLNTGYNVLIERDRTFIVHKWIPCGKTFLLVHNMLASFPWHWLLAHLLKDLTSAITFEPKEIVLQWINHGYYLWQNLSVRTKIFDPVILTSNFV